MQKKNKKPDENATSNIEPSHGAVGLQHQSLSSPHMRDSISHPKNDFESICSHNPTKASYALVQK